MKKVILLFVMLSLFTSCKKKKSEPEPVNEPFNTTSSTLVAQSAFTSNAHPTSGTVKLYSQRDSKTLVFENFQTDNGPDLRVYLSTTTGNSNFIELGALKSTSGNFNYNVDSSINTSTYKYVLIWCEDFAVLFGNSKLN